jgi:hypothetical protein
MGNATLHIMRQSSHGAKPSHARLGWTTAKRWVMVVVLKRRVTTEWWSARDKPEDNMECYETDCLEWFDLSASEAELLSNHGFDVQACYYERRDRNCYYVAVEKHQVATIIALLS